MTLEKKKSALTEALSMTDHWDELINWNGDGMELNTLPVLNDPGLPTGFRAGDLMNFEHLFDQSSATSVAEGPASEYIASAPPSIAAPSSFEQGQPWLASPLIASPTSPLLDRAHHLYSVSYEASDGGLSPFGQYNAPPFFETENQSFGSSNSYQTAAAVPFNQNLPGSPYSSVGIDMPESDSFSNVGTWTNGSFPPLGPPDDICGSQGIGTIPEDDYEGGMSIPQITGGSQSFSNTYAAHPWGSTPSGEQQQPQQTRSRAVTIPRAHNHRAPPLLSVSPEAGRYSKSFLSRVYSNRNDARRKGRLATPSPTSNEFGWVSYQPSAQTNKLMPITDANSSRRVKGRTGALSLEQRTSTAAVRRHKACDNCRKRKEKCDLGVPCQSCLAHFKGELINHPCRDTKVSNLCEAFLSKRLGWHPTERNIDSSMAPYSYHISDHTSYSIPLSFGFGPPLHLPVHVIDIEGQPELCHDHIVYSWPPSATSFRKDTDAILPVVLTLQTQVAIGHILDNHLAHLVQQHFKEFPLYQSPLRILGEIYLLYLRLPATSPYSLLLLQSLKLLVLVHIGGDITLLPPSQDANLQLIMRMTMPSLANEDEHDMPTPTPCFIRSQFGAIMPSLAQSLMNEVLTSLEPMLLNRDPAEWPIALSTLMVVLITVESIQYHAAKLPYHHSYDSRMQQESESQSRKDDDGVNTLLAFYSACFIECHARLGEHSQGESLRGESWGSPEDRFVAGMREAVGRARSGGYLEDKAEARRVGDDMAFFFDRLAARLLVLRA